MFRGGEFEDVSWTFRRLAQSEVGVVSRDVREEGGLWDSER